MTVTPGAGMVDVSTPETQFADEVRNWITALAQVTEKARQVVDTAYARSYLTTWPDDTSLTDADLQACVDLANELLAETSEPNKTLYFRLRRDV
jgi:class 3 adenylate cyclase